MKIEHADDSWLMVNDVFNKHLHARNTWYLPRLFILVLMFFYVNNELLFQWLSFQARANDVWQFYIAI